MTPKPSATPHLAAPSRRRFLRWAGLSAAGAALAACTPVAQRFSPPPTPAGAAVQLVYQDWNTDWYPAMAQKLLEQFHAENPDIRVYFVLDPVNLEEKMPADMQAGRASDVFQGCCHFLPAWGQKGYCLDLRDYVAKDLDRAILDDWDPAQYHALFTADGRQFALPKYHGALALFYNRDLFDEYGVEYPDDTWDHDDYLTAMQRLTHDRNGDGKTDLWGSMVDVDWDRIQVHVNAWGGHFVDPADPTHSLMAEPPALAAMEWLRARMWDDNVMATLLDVQNTTISQAFLDGKLAMVEEGSWRLRDILSNAKFRLGVAPMPAGPARRATLATTDGLAIYSGTKNPDAAWKLLKFLVSKDAGRAMAQAHFLQPARSSLVEEWAGFIRAEFPEQTKDLNINAFADGHLKGYSVVAEAFSNMTEAQRLAYQAWDQIYTLGQAPVDSMKTVSRQIEDAQHSGA